MKEFLEQLYSNESFPIILFSTIGILIFLFIVTIFLAAHDAKKRKKLEEQKTLENSQESSVNIPEVNTPVFEDIKFDEVKKSDASFSFNTVEQPVAVEVPTPVVEQNTVEVKEEVKLPEVELASLIDENLDLPKVTISETNELKSLDEEIPTKVVLEEDVVNVKSLNDIESEEFKI